MRLMAFVLLLLMGLAACATATSSPPLSDAERCRRFGGSFSNGTCRYGAP
jgi:hypothetical protein